MYVGSLHLERSRDAVELIGGPAHDLQRRIPAKTPSWPGDPSRVLLTAALLLAALKACCISLIAGSQTFCVWRCAGPSVHCFVAPSVSLLFTSHRRRFQGPLNDITAPTSFSFSRSGFIRTTSPNTHRSLVLPGDAVAPLVKTPHHVA